jgi:putative membrane protein
VQPIRLRRVAGGHFLNQEFSMHKLALVSFAAGLSGLIAGQASAALSSADRDFARKAASGGMAEVQAAQLAQQKAGSPQVKDFASRMITDHTQANNELQQIAQQESITLPSRPNRKEMAAERKLQGMSGTSFDRGYAQDELRDHQQDVALFRKEASSGQDPALKEFAQKTLPTLQQHLQMAQALVARHQ